MMSFAGDRLRADMESAEDFAKAGSPQELFDKQCSFARRAAQQYAEETSKLIGMVARIQQSCWARSEEHTSELQSLMRISYAVFCLKKKKDNKIKQNIET